MADSKKNIKPIVDVAHPGKSAPAGTSKPVIVTNRPILQDPMVVTQEGSKPEEDSGTPVSVKTTAPTLKPTEDKAKAEPKLESTPKAEPESDPDEIKSPATDGSLDDAADDKPRDPEAEAAAEADAEAAEKTKTDETVQKLVDSKQYYLPINSVEKRKTKRFIALGVLLAVVLAVAWADVALDAGLVHLGNIKPVTHFFSN
ncbi:MAG TPA: hypothetical protein VHB51_01780 [Candidatus Saccharimonadales bacterium]|nr:hypothetical protein [Candidatus Saccharimonadales bacterium]